MGTRAFAATASDTLAAVPTGTVDLVTITSFARHAAADEIGDREHMREIRRSVFVRGRADRDEHDVARRDAPATSVVKLSRPAA